MNGKRCTSMFYGSQQRRLRFRLQIWKRTRRIDCWPVEAKVKVQGIEIERLNRKEDIRITSVPPMHSYICFVLVAMFVWLCAEGLMASYADKSIFSNSALRYWLITTTCSSDNHIWRKWNIWFAKIDRWDVLGKLNWRNFWA